MRNPRHDSLAGKRNERECFPSEGLVKSLVRNILRASPYFAIFCGPMEESKVGNSNRINILPEIDTQKSLVYGRIRTAGIVLVGRRNAEPATIRLATDKRRITDS
jgi:hypothetical protein